MTKSEVIRLKREAKKFETRCQAIFGPGWRKNVAANFHCTRQNIDNIMSGKHAIKTVYLDFLSAWETGKLKPTFIVNGKAGRPFKKAVGK